MRFPGFEGEWETRKLIEIASKITDGTHDTPKPTKKGVPFLTAIHIKDGFIDYENCYYIDEEVHNSIFKRCNPQKGDLLIVNIGAGTATCALNTVDYQFSLKNVALVKPNKHIMDGRFLIQVQRKNSAKIFYQLTSGGAQPFLSLNELGRLKITFPSLLEQNKIATFLSFLDERILTQSKIIEDYEMLLNHMSTHLLSRKIRFIANRDDRYSNWKTKKIGEVLTIGSGKDYKHLNIGKVPVFGTGGLMTHVDGHLHEGETVCIGRKGTIDKPMYFNGKIWTVDTLFFTHSFKDALPKYIYYAFRGINWKEYNEGSGVPSLSKRTIEKIEIELPRIDEQEKIAGMLSLLEEKMQLEQLLLNKFKEQKRHLLNKLFI